MHVKRNGNAFDMHFNALKTLRSFASLNEIKRKKTTKVLKMHLNAEKIDWYI